MKKATFLPTFLYICIEMMMEGIIPGWERYKIVIDDVSVRCINVESGKPLKNRVGNKNPSVTWRLVTGDKSLMLKAERFIQMTFPEIERKDYIYQLYNGIPNTVSSRTKKVEISKDIILELLFGPTCYCLTIPFEMNIKKEIKNMFPGPYIEVEKGNIDAKRKEIYFTSKEHLLVVKEKMLDFFSDF